MEDGDSFETDGEAENWVPIAVVLRSAESLKRCDSDPGEGTLTTSLESELSSSQPADGSNRGEVEEFAKDMEEADEVPDGTGSLSTAEKELRVVDGGRTSASSKGE
jgi:hypothetical protein